MDPEVQEVPVTADVVVLDSDDTAGAAAPPPAPTTRDDPLEDLEKALENACETIASFAENVINFSYESQDVLYSKVNEFVKDLQHIDQKSKGVNAVIPLEVIEAIDKGRNPEHCTLQMLESCAEANDVARGKLDAMRNFRDLLEKAMDEPEEETKPDGKDAPGGVKRDVAAARAPNTGLHSLPTGNGTTNGF